MTPLMILFFHMRPETAVGTDLAYTFVTKSVGAIQHIRQRTVDLFAVKYLSYGSVPGSLLGALSMAKITHHYSTDTVGTIVSNTLGVAYIFVGLTLAIQWFTRRDTKLHSRCRHLEPALIVLGLVTGFIVGLTSVGSGSLYIAVLAIFYPLSVSKLVGTDLVQSIVMTGVAALTHWAIGTIDFKILLYLLIGSIPGILIGSKLTVRIPNFIIRFMLIALLCWSSINMISI